jgi:AcrR family transcriptional regulator
MQTPTRRIGRPRIVERTSDIATVEQILLEAGRLFTQNGYHATTTREIAEAAGLRQGSLYHYFQRKEDILADLLDRILERALMVAAWIEGERASAPASLWALAYLDVCNYCSGPYNVVLLARLPDARQPRFADFWAGSVELQHSYEGILERGRADDVLAFDDLSLTAKLLFGIADGPVDWFDPTRHERTEVAALTARAMLMTVLAYPVTLDAFVAEGRALAARAPHIPNSLPHRTHLPLRPDHRA